MSRTNRRHERGPSDTAGSFAVECPACRAAIGVTRDLVGRAAGCPECHEAFLVPPAALAAATSPDFELPRGLDRPRRPAGRRKPTATRAEPRPKPRAEPVVFVEPPVPSTRRRPQAAAIADPATSVAEAIDPVLVFREPTRTIRTGTVEIELMRLSPEARVLRRTRRNLAMLVVGAAILVALAILLGGIRW